MEKKQTEIKQLKEGSFVLIDDIPCRVDSISLSKPGKHGGAKARVSAVGLFDGQRRIITKPAAARADIPIIEKKAMQVIAIVGKNVQVMDLTDYSTKEMAVPEELEGQLKEGDELVVWQFGQYSLIKGKKA